MGFDAGDVAHKLSNRLKMRHLALLLQIRRHGSLTRAAEHMAISQPALTNTLNDLEGMFGAPLFERSARGMAPTLLGRVVLDHAQAMVQDLDHLVRDMDAVAGGHTAHLHIGVTPFVPSRVLPAALQQAARDGRRLTVTVQGGPGELLLSQLQDHTLDIVVGLASPTPSQEGLNFYALYSQPPRLIANRRLAARLTRQRLDWRRLAGLDWIMSPSATYLREQVASLFVEAGLPVPRPVMESDAARLIGEMQDEVMLSRMVPVGQVFDRFPRLVRDAAHALGKQIVFSVEGNDIELGEAHRRWAREDEQRAPRQVPHHVHEHRGDRLLRVVDLRRHVLERGDGDRRHGDHDRAARHLRERRRGVSRPDVGRLAQRVELPFLQRQ